MSKHLGLRCHSSWSGRDSDHDWIVLHIALIDRQYAVAWPQDKLSLPTVIMAVAIEMATDRLRQSVRPASLSMTHGGRVAGRHGEERRC